MKRLSFAKKLFLSLFLAVFSIVAFALEIDNVKVPETVKIDQALPALQLQGAGIRTKFLFDIYVGAFYTEQAINSTEEALTDLGAKRMWFKIVYSDISGKQFRDAWQEGIKANNSSDVIKKYQQSIDQFINFFHQDMVKGDTLTIDYLPKIGTRVEINHKLKGVIAGDEFYSLVLSTWMGENPPSQKFQNALLGQD